MIAALDQIIRPTAKTKTPPYMTAHMEPVTIQSIEQKADRQAYADAGDNCGGAMLGHHLVRRCNDEKVDRRGGKPHPPDAQRAPRLAMLPPGSLLKSRSPL